MASTPGETAGIQADKVLLAGLGGERRDPPPVWMMRQAGRYLPEYRQLREQKGGFLDLVYDSDAAAEITLQPLERFPELDAAILFSDILIVPFAIGQNLSFVAGEGPRLTPPLSHAALDQLTPVPARLEPIYETVRKVRQRSAPDKALIGFAGSPWTVATYMVAGQGSREQAEARRLAYADPGAFAEIIGRIEEVTLDYLSGQIEAGAEAVQLFDSWAGSLSPAQFEQWVIGPTARLVAGLKARHPAVPVIGFPKGAGGKLRAYARETGVTAVGLDETVDPHWAAKELPVSLPVQGNLDPLALIAGGETLSSAAERILDAFAGRPHIFNLGHGILPDTPIAHVEQLLGLVKGGKVTQLTGFLGPAYLWVKAAHLTFVIFWMAGLFLLPRFYVYHQETTVGSPDDRAWIEREARVRSIILAPAMVLVWALGLMLAIHLNIWSEHWFQAKLALVVALSGYQGWLGRYGKKLANGERPLSGKAVRMINEIPGIAAALIVVLVIVRPF